MRTLARRDINVAAVAQMADADSAIPSHSLGSRRAVVCHSEKKCCGKNLHSSLHSCSPALIIMAHESSDLYWVWYRHQRRSARRTRRSVAIGQQERAKCFQLLA